MGLVGAGGPLDNAGLCKSYVLIQNKKLEKVFDEATKITCRN